MKLEKILDYIRKKQFLVYILTFVIFFTIFFLLRFPGDYIIQRLIYRFNENSNVKIGYRDVDFSLFSGITFDDLQIILPEQSFTISKLHVTPSYLSLLGGKLRTGVKIKDPDLILTGYIERKGKKTNLNLTIKKLNLALLNTFKDRLKARLSGEVKGKVELSFPGRWEKSKGLIALEGSGITIADNPYIEMIGKKELPMGTLSAMGRINNGKLQIETFKLGERDFYVKLGGSLTLKTPLINSIANLQIKLKLNRELQEKLGAFLPAAGFTRTPGGVYVKKLRGRLTFLFR